MPETEQTTTEQTTETQETTSTPTETNENNSSEKTVEETLYPGNETKTEENNNEQSEEKKEDEQKDDEKKEAEGEITAADIVLPEGVEPASEEQVGEFVTLANKHNLSKEVVKDLVNYQANLMKQASERAGEVFQEMQNEWQKDAHTLYKGADNLEVALARISGVITMYGKEEGVPEGAEQSVRDVFAFTGAGNHPQMIKFMDWISSHFSEGEPVSGNPGTTEDRTAANILYPDMK